MDKVIFENYSNPKLAGLEVGYHRIASRGLVFLPNRKMLAFVKQKTGQYKLPGGGKEGDETPEETFRREVLEETGYTVKNLHTLGITKGYTQDSYVFAADADEYHGEHPDDAELADDAKPIEISPEEFLEEIKKFLAEHKDGTDEDSMIKYAIALRDYQIVKYFLDNERSNNS